MDNLGHRALTGQLAEDLGWLEEHTRRRGGGLSAVANPSAEAVHASELRLAAALVRNCIGPYLDGQSPTPLHIAVVGGAGAGKSTVANLLSGAAAAEANPQAGYTRHPIVYTSAQGVMQWTGYAGFLGSLQRAPQESAANLDADVYQVRRVPQDPTSADLLKEWAVWDCPDMTTWAAGGHSANGASSGGLASHAPGYISRLLEIAALADVLVYVASDERYNDEVPTQFLRLFLQTGKPVVACLTKMREADAAPLVQHFKREVVRQLPPGVVDCVAIPFLRADQLADPARNANEHRIPLLNQVAVLGQDAAAARRRTVAGALRYLIATEERLLAVARDDVTAMESWRAAVRSGQVEFDQRYRREYLTGEKYRGFDDALERLLNLLELPGAGKAVSILFWVLRAPYRLVKALLGRAVKRPESPSLPELPILEDSLSGWIDGLRKEAARHSGSHLLWAHIAHGFASGGLAELTDERFRQAFRSFQMALADETDRTARATYEHLERNTGLLNFLRGGKLLLDALAIFAVVYLTGSLLAILILVPIAASLTHQVVELVARWYVDIRRERVRGRQEALMAQYISSPLAEWLSQWPATGGSAFERLLLALRRIPQNVELLKKAVEAKG